MPDDKNNKINSPWQSLSTDSTNDSEFDSPRQSRSKTRISKRLSRSLSTDCINDKKPNSPWQSRSKTSISKRLSRSLSTDCVNDKKPNSPWQSSSNSIVNYKNIDPRVGRFRSYNASKAGDSSKIYANNKNIGDRLSRPATAPVKQTVFIHKDMSQGHIKVNDKRNDKDIIFVTRQDYENRILNEIKSKCGDVDIKFLQHGQKGTSKGDITGDDKSMSKVIDAAIDRAYRDKTCKNISISNVQCYGDIGAVWNYLINAKDLKYIRNKTITIKIGDPKYSGWADSKNRANYIRGASGAIYRRNILEIKIDDSGKPRVMLNYVDVTKEFSGDQKCSFEELRKKYVTYTCKDGKTESAIDPVRIAGADKKYSDDYVAYMMRKFYIQFKDQYKEKENPSMTKSDRDALIRGAQIKALSMIRGKYKMLSEKAQKLISNPDTATESGYKKAMESLSKSRNMDLMTSSRKSSIGRYFDL